VHISFRSTLIIVFSALLAVALYILPANAGSLKKSGGHKTKTSTTAHRTQGNGNTSQSTKKHPLSSGKTAAHNSGFSAINLDTSGKGLKPGPNLAPGSNPSVLPTDVLIADRTNSRLLIVNPAGKIVWEFPQPGDLAKGQSFLLPDDAFFTPNGKYIVATEEDDQVISLISIAGHKIIWRYGTPGVPGSTANHVSNPDDAMMLSNGDIITADIKNCSILILRPPLHVPIERIGENNQYCYHQPPLRFGSPNGAFPLTDGNYLISEINGDWADEMSLSGKILWSANPPGVLYPSDTNEIAPNQYLTVDYSIPGQIVEFNSTGKLLWRYRPLSGPGALNEPSLCRPIETNGDILCNDDGDDRVIVVDPKTNKIVWQYGHDHVHGTAPGYLHRPDGVDLAPPYSLTMVHASTMGLPTGQCSASAPQGTCTFYSASGAPSSVPTSVTKLGLGRQKSPYADPLLNGQGSGSAQVNTSKSHLTSFDKHAKSGKKANPKTTKHRSSVAGTASKTATSVHIAKMLPLWHLKTPVSREVALGINKNNVLIVGGMNSDGSSTSSVYLLNTALDRMESVGSLTYPTHDASGAILNGKGYVFGGGNSTSISAIQELAAGDKSLSAALPSGGKKKSTKAYSLVSKVTGNLAAPRSDSSSVTIGSHSYIVGGYSGTGPDGNVLSVANGNKVVVIGHLAVPVRYPGVAALGDTIYVFGGEEVLGANAGEPTSIVQTINIKSGSSSVITHLPVALAGTEAVSSGGHIIVCGGDESVNSSGMGSNTNAAIWLFNTKNSRFTNIGKLKTPVSHAAIEASNSQIRLFGGESDGVVVSDVQGFALS